jgi:hypothetical protein
MAKQNTTLTSVRIPDELFKQFQIECIKTKFSITKLTERAMYLYVTSPEFQTLIQNQLDIQLKSEN